MYNNSRLRADLIRSFLLALVLGLAAVWLCGIPPVAVLGYVLGSLATTLSAMVSLERAKIQEEATDVSPAATMISPGADTEKETQPMARRQLFIYS